MDSPEQASLSSQAVPIPVSRRDSQDASTMASSAPNPRIHYSTSSSSSNFDNASSSEEEGDSSDTPVEQNPAMRQSFASGRASPLSTISSGSSSSSASTLSSISPTAVYSTMLNSNNIHASSQPVRLPNPPTFLAHKRLQFLIMDAPSQSNLRLYLQEMQKSSVSHVVRLCEPTYSKEIVEAAGIRVHDWVFPDGESPPVEVIDKWLQLVDSVSKEGEFGQEKTIAVHCVAGLGRAPVLVAIALIESGMKPLDAVTFIRQRRRGAINNKQLKFLESYRPRGRETKCLVM